VLNGDARPHLDEFEWPFLNWTQRSVNHKASYSANLAGELTTEMAQSGPGAG